MAEPVAARLLAAPLAHRVGIRNPHSPRTRGEKRRVAGAYNGTRDWQSLAPLGEEDGCAPPFPSVQGFVRLKVIRPSTNNLDVFTVVGASEYLEPVGGPNPIFATRLTVRVGDLIALGVKAGGHLHCAWHKGTSAADLYRARTPTDEDPAPSVSRSWNPGSTNDRLSISAIVEPDLDGDGFGDESQDQCPGVAGSVNGCPPTTSSSTTSTTLPACVSFPECEPLLKAALPVPAVVVRRAKATARKLAALERAAARAYGRAVTANGRTRTRLLGRARSALNQLVAQARAAVHRGRLGVPLVPIETLVTSLLGFL